MKYLRQLCTIFDISDVLKLSLTIFPRRLFLYIWSKFLHYFATTINKKAILTMTNPYLTRAIISFWISYMLYNIIASANVL